MIRRLVSIGLIVGLASAAWFVLGSTLVIRTQASDDEQRTALASLWGTEQTQRAPDFDVERQAFGPPDRHHTRTLVTTADALPIASTRADVDLSLAQRRKGLLWYATYRVAFAATYVVRNEGKAGRMTVVLPFPADKATYDDVSLTIDGQRIPVQTTTDGLVGSLPLRAGESPTVNIRYRSSGLGTWTYAFGTGVSAVRDFSLTMHTDFDAIDFPPDTLAPTDKIRTPAGWLLQWRYHNLVAGYGIGMAFPERLQPGPLAQRITFWAPLSLGFYVFVLLVITTLRRIDLHPINYFFLACAFFSFHLLFAYLVDRISIEAAFAICSIVSLALTISYLRLVAGLRFAAVEAALAQGFYLILFSLALFNEGSSGLSITIGAIVTLFVTMQVTGRIRWSDRFDRTSSA